MTRPLFAPRAWAGLTGTIESSASLLIGLDLDGTLAPIVSRPSRARVGTRTLRLLDQCARSPGVRVAIVSARSAAAVRRLIPIRRLIRIGQYGLEGRLAPSAASRAALRRSAARIAHVALGETEAVPGAWVEAKGFSVAIHGRGVARARLASYRRMVGRIAAAARGAGFRLVTGDHVFELVPRGFDKGTALRRLIRAVRPAATLYFGDSEADEPAFRELGPRDIPVRVGPGPTSASFRVANPGGVARVLSAVVRLRSAGAPTTRR
jgi:trehalose-phosphatase